MLVLRQSICCSSIHPSIYLSTYLSTYLPTYLPIYLHITYLSSFFSSPFPPLVFADVRGTRSKVLLGDTTQAKKRFLPNWANCAKDTTANGRQQQPLRRRKLLRIRQCEAERRRNGAGTLRKMLQFHGVVNDNVTLFSSCSHSFLRFIPSPVNQSFCLYHHLGGGGGFSFYFTFRWVGGDDSTWLLHIFQNSVF